MPPYREYTLTERYAKMESQQATSRESLEETSPADHRAAAKKARNSDPHSLATLFTPSRWVCFPKFLTTDSYLKQVGAKGALFVLTLCAAYDAGRAKYPEGVVNGRFAIPDDHIRELWGEKTTAGVRAARKRVLDAVPSFLAEVVPGKTGYPTVYKIRATTDADRVNPGKKTAGMEPRTQRPGFPTESRPGLPVTASGQRATDWLGCALSYLGRGFSVLPVRGKLPAPGVLWRPYQSRRPGECDLRGWHRQFPDAGIAIVTGGLSNLVVVDIDGALDDGFRSLQAAGIDVPETTRVRSARGYHLWFSHPGVPVNNVARLLKEGSVSIDIRGDGGYIVAPPSIHESGVRYCFEHEVDKLPVLPPRLLELVRARAATRSHAQTDDAPVQMAEDAA